MFVVAAVLLFLRYRRWRDTLAWSKTMAPTYMRHE